jgi:pimeloyl-ACP methyl ester carboxylesterase
VLAAERIDTDEDGLTSAAAAVRLAGLAADDQGDTEHCPPVVLLHGLSFDRRMWRPVMDALKRIEPGRRVVALDLPGHGDSPGWAAYDVETLAEGVYRAVSAARLAPPVVVGHSMSAVVATVYAARYPTAGVINVDQPLEVASFARLVQSLAADLRGPRFAEVWARFEASMHAELLPPAGRALLASTRRPSQDLVVGYWRDLLERSPVELGAWAGDVLAELRAKHVPYLVVSGTEVSTDYRRWLGEVLPQAEILVWPESSHFPHLADPDRFAGVLATSRPR